MRGPSLSTTPSLVLESTKICLFSHKNIAKNTEMAETTKPPVSQKRTRKLSSLRLVEEPKGSMSGQYLFEDLKGNLLGRPYYIQGRDLTETYKRPSVILIDFANHHVLITIFCEEEFDVREFLKSSHNTTLTWLHGEKLVKFIRGAVGSSRFIVNMDARLAV
ncbi:hypothetical protein C5167_013343 [Papaver somniferum]|uniref:Uncharacterized protein n=1 Tax=Papaver somniferum TaxID=3469 RepID=A0A4Y7J4A1_PAPSO|nr:hypothetical protein C5167_013343 [Papaver somniferum]